MNVLAQVLQGDWFILDPPVMTEYSRNHQLQAPRRPVQASSDVGRRRGMPCNWCHSTIKVG